MDFWMQPWSWILAWYLQQALDELLRWHVGSKIAAWASAIETGLGESGWNPGGYLMGKEWIKGVLCYMSANGWWDRSLNYHMQQIVGNKLWHHWNWNKNKTSLFWLPSLFELCDLSLNCTPGTSGDNFMILHTFRPKHSLWRSKKSFRRLEALERGRPCQRSLVWSSGARNVC